MALLNRSNPNGKPQRFNNESEVNIMLQRLSSPVNEW